MKHLAILTVLLAATTASANMDVTATCEIPAQQVLTKHMKQEVEINTLLEVGAGTYDVDHLAIVSLPGAGGIVYKALLTADAETCEFKVQSVQRIY